MNQPGQPIRGGTPPPVRLPALRCIASLLVSQLLINRLVLIGVPVIQLILKRTPALMPMT
jgi:hypothetical protein